MLAKKMPDITLSSDIIVGFPGETDEDFEQTLRLVQDTRFDLLFTFLYSPRTGTPAASYEDNASPQDKQRRFERLLKTQDDIVAEKQAAYQEKNAASAGRRSSQGAGLSVYRPDGGQSSGMRTR